MGNMRFFVFWVFAAIVLGIYFLTDPSGGRETLMRLQWLVWVAVLSGPVYLLRRAFHPEFRGHELATQVKQGNVSAGIVVAGMMVLTGLLFIALCGRASAAPLPPRAAAALPVLDSEVTAQWPKMPVRSVLGALVEQETCPSLTSSKCWNSRAELKTSREYGFGLGQLTVAYRSDGSERFNAFSDVKRADRSLSGWTWENRYDARMQLRAVVVMSRSCFGRMRPLVADDYNALAMCDAAYNGGMGGVLSERRLCAASPGCNANVWFGNVEVHSLKSRERWQGYGQSAFEINRGHVRAVMVTRRQKYAAWWGEPWA